MIDSQIYHFRTAEIKMCKLTKNVSIHRRGVGISGIRGMDLTKGRVKIEGGGVESPSELCFGTSKIESYVSWSYIMYTFLTLL